MRRIFPATIVVLAVVIHPSIISARGKAKSSPKTVPVTTASAQAAELFEKGMVDYENLHLDRATQEWRDAAKADPNFALAQAWVAFTSTDPAEAADYRDRAKELAPRVTPGEQLMIKWLVNVQENDFVTGISAMNDML